MLIKPTYPSRGFAKLNLSKKLAQRFSDYCCKSLPDLYEFEMSGNDIRIRNNERRLGNEENYLEIIAEVDRNNNRDANWIRNIDPYFKKYEMFYPNAKVAFKLMQDIDKKPIHYQIEKTFTSIFFIESDKRQSFIKDYYLNWFFKNYPDGKILVLRKNSNFGKRLSILRCGMLFNIYGEEILDKLFKKQGEGIRTVDSLHPTGGINVAPYLSVIANSFLPYTVPIILDSIAFTLILFTNMQNIIDRGPYPRSIIDLYKFDSLMKGNKPDLKRLKDISQAWLGRYMPNKSFSAEEFVLLFKYALPKINQLIRLRLDITNYRTGNMIDFIIAFERYFTLDRITYEISYCQCAIDGFSARYTLFSIVDKISEMIDKNNVSIFKNIFTKQYCNNYLIPKLKLYPKPFNIFFISEAKRIYNSLYNTILGSEGLWMKHRRT